MQKLVLNVLLITLSIIWLAFPILATIATNKIGFIYDINPNKVGFKLKRRTWGPSYKDTKKIFQLTDDDYIKQKAKDSISLWKISYNCLYISIGLYIVVLVLSKLD